LWLAMVLLNRALSWANYGKPKTLEIDDYKLLLSANGNQGEDQGFGAWVFRFRILVSFVCFLKYAHTAFLEPWT